MIGRVAQHIVKARLHQLCPFQYISTDHLKSAGKGRGCSIVLRIAYSSFVYLHAYNLSFGNALGYHQGYQSTAASHIDQSLLSFHLSPSSKKYSVGTDLHGAVFIVHRKLLKGKHQTPLTF